jgi:hypothetical protein
VLSVRDGRWAVKCNECPIRMDLAPAAMPEERLRFPTGWMGLGDGAHVCPQCSPKWLSQMDRAMSRRPPR